MTNLEYTEHKYGVVVPLGDIKLDLAVQRAVIPARVHKLSQNFDKALVGELLLSQREDGFFYVIDGHHRLDVLQKNGATEAAAEVFSGLSRPDEARLFLGRNDRANINQHARVRSNATAGDEETLTIQNVMQSVGRPYVTDEPKAVKFRDTATAVAIMRMGERAEGTGPEFLGRVMRVEARAYGVSELPESDLLKGIAGLLVQAGGLDQDRLNDKMMGLPPQHIVRLGEARRDTVAEATGKRPRLATMIRLILAEEYNRGLPHDSDRRIDVR